MNRPALLIALMLSLISAEALAEPALSAAKVLANAQAQASAQHKNIFLTFDASW
jgi:hypothetical protein